MAFNELHFSNLPKKSCFGTSAFRLLCDSDLVFFLKNSSAFDKSTQPVSFETASFLERASARLCAGDTSQLNIDSFLDTTCRVIGFGLEDWRLKEQSAGESM
jgi:hypothetical protein